jgi:hypothetical protein
VLPWLKSGFVDNVVVDGDGHDLVIFESGRPEAFSVSVFDAITQSFSPPRIYLPAPTGCNGGCGFPLNAAQIDLADFNVVADNARALFRIDNLGAPGCCDGADLMDVLALHTGPPASRPIVVPAISFESSSGADTATVVAGSTPSFFQCGVTPELGEPTLPAPGGFDGADLADVRALHSAVAVPLEAKPGSSVAPINLAARGVLPVAVLSTPSFDALALDSASIAIGDPEAGHTAKPVASSVDDLNGDDRADLLLRFSTEELVATEAVSHETTRLVLTARSADWALGDRCQRRSNRSLGIGAAGGGNLPRVRIRVLFAFDPQRAAVLVIGGGKTGEWVKWYNRMVPLAADLTCPPGRAGRRRPGTPPAGAAGSHARSRLRARAPSRADAGRAAARPTHFEAVWREQGSLASPAQAPAT